MSATLTLATVLVRMSARYSLISTLFGPWSTLSSSEEILILQHAFSSTSLFCAENLLSGLILWRTLLFFNLLFRPTYRFFLVENASLKSHFFLRPGGLRLASLVG